MKTKNIYNLPINLAQVTDIQTDSLAHVGDLVYAIDYDAPVGTPVYAAQDGKVIFVRDDSDRGGVDPSFEEDANYIEILHANGEVSEYEHLDQYSATVQVGQNVKSGDQIARVGNTGWSACPHLHFMVYPHDEAYVTREIQFYSQD